MTKPLPYQQQGMGLVAAIFVITLMALMATGISRLVVTTQQSNSQQIMSIRAQLAAESVYQGNLVKLHTLRTCPESSSELLLPAFPSCTISFTCNLQESTTSTFLLQQIAVCGEGKDQSSFQYQQEISLLKK